MDIHLPKTLSLMNHCTCHEDSVCFSPPLFFWGGLEMIETGREVQRWRIKSIGIVQVLDLYPSAYWLIVDKSRRLSNAIEKGIIILTLRDCIEGYMKMYEEGI